MTNGDYISREANGDDFVRRADIVEKFMDRLPSISVGYLCKVADEIPAADVRPVNEGHWVKARGNWCSPGGDPVWECSECGKGVHVYGIEHGTYGSDIADGQWVSCPNCGAEMGGTP